MLYRSAEGFTSLEPKSRQHPFKPLYFDVHRPVSIPHSSGQDKPEESMPAIYRASSHTPPPAPFFFQNLES